MTQFKKDVIKRFLDYLYEHGIICVNSLTFFFNTTMTDKEINICKALKHIL